jgi:DeoR/GlpR family transcriptional regulator of sugar metabolism
MGLLAENRHFQILEQLRSKGRVQVNTLAEELGVTRVTIRRDLAFLQKNGLLKKTYGGAVLAELPEINVSVRFRQTRNLPAKKIIGKLASQQIINGDNIYLEAGSTCYEIIPYLSQYKDLTIIVNSLHLMSRLHELVQHKVIVIGGQYRHDRMDMVGPTAENTIAQLSGFKAFTGADDISINAGISGADVTTVSFTKLVLQQASKVIFVGDHSKFDNPALYKIADIDQLNCIITDRQPQNKWRDITKKMNIPLVYPQ